MNFGSWFVVQSNFLSFITIIMAPRKKQSFEDVTVELNYSQAIRDQMKFNKKYTNNEVGEWDEERVFYAAQFCKVFHNKTLNPYVIQKFLNEFVETIGFSVDYQEIKP